MATKCELSSVSLGAKPVRFLYFRSSGHFYVTSRRKEEDIPLFLGADVLAGASVLTKNHGRIHSRYAKDKFASKVGLQGVRIDGINNSGHLWFYTIQGLFRVAFEYLDRAAQRDCLLHMRDLWLSTHNVIELPDELEATYLQEEFLDLPPLGTGATVLHQLTPTPPPEGRALDISLQVAAQSATDAANTGHHEQTPPVVVNDVCQQEDTDTFTSPNSDSIHCPSVGSSNMNTDNESDIKINDCNQHSISSDADIQQRLSKEYDGESDLHRLVSYVCDFIHKQGQKMSETHCSALRKLDILLQFFKNECLDDSSGVPGFPCEILDQYNKLVTDRTMDKYFSNSFNVPIRTNIALCLMSEWLGKELSGFSELISHKVEKFKLEHIDSINDLPSPQSLIDLLFPACMKILMVNWMGQHGTGYGEDNSSSVSLSVESDHDYSPPVKKRANSTKSRNSNTSVFPFVQLILEFANNVLISGVAHVLYSRLLHDGRC